jgi:hypothetical protein
VSRIYPVKGDSFSVGKDAPIEWKATAARAEARLDGGKAGEVVLQHNPTAMSAEPTVIKNLRYFAAARNEGFVLMPNEVQAFRVGKNAFETRGTNGFMITPRAYLEGREVRAKSGSGARGQRSAPPGADPSSNSPTFRRARRPTRTPWRRTSRGW